MELTAVPPKAPTIPPLAALPFVLMLALLISVPVVDPLPPAPFVPLLGLDEAAPPPVAVTSDPKDEVPPVVPVAVPDPLVVPAPPKPIVIV
jgi:hypothetical protein